MSEDVPLEPIEFFGPEVTFNWSYEEAPVPQFELEFTCGLEPNINVVRKIVENKPDRIDEETKRRHYSVLLTQAENRGNRSHPSRHIKVRVRALGPTGAPYSEWLERVGHNKPPKLVPAPRFLPSIDKALISITEPDVPDRVAYRIHRTLSPTEPLSAANMVSQGPDTNVSIDLPKNEAGENPDYFFPIAAIDSFGPDELDWVVIGPVSNQATDPNDIEDIVTEIISPQLGAINDSIAAANTARENAVNALNGQLTVINGKITLSNPDADSIGSRFLATESQTNNHAQRITGMETIVGTDDGSGLRARLFTAETTIANLETQKASSTRVTSLENEVLAAREGEASLKANLDKMDQTFVDGLAGKASASELTNLTARVTTAENTNTAQNTRLSTVEAEVADKASASEVNTLKTEVETARNGKTTLGAELTAMKTATSDGLAGKASASDLSALTTRVSNTETTNTAQNSRLNTVETDLAGKASSTSVENLQAEITSARGGAANLSGRFTAVNQTIVDGLAGKASTTSVSNLTATVNDHSASISLANSVAVEANNRAKAIIGLTSTVGGVVTGLTSVNTGSTSSFKIQADIFELVPSSSSGARTEFSSGAWKIYDAAGRKRIHLGLA